MLVCNQKIISIFFIIIANTVVRSYCSSKKAILEEILRNVKEIQGNCQSHHNHHDKAMDETHLETVVTRLSYIESKLEGFIETAKLTGNQKNLEEKLNTIERSVVNSFERLAKKYEELSEIIRGLQTMAIINHNSTDEKIRKVLNAILGFQEDRHSSESSQQGKSITNTEDITQELQTFWDKKLANLELTVRRHINLAKDEVKELFDSSKSSLGSKSCSSESSSEESSMDQLKSDLVDKLTRIENKIKFSSQEVNFKLDNQLYKLEDLLANISSLSNPHQETVQVEARTIESTATEDGQTITSSPLSIGSSEPTVTRRCLVSPDDNLMKNCSIQSFKSTWKTCADIMDDNITCNGVYLIMMDPRPSRVYCDMSDNGGGWMVIMRRGNFTGKPFNFNQNWFLYKYGFGDQKGEYWLGNEYVHRITSSTPHQLQIDLESYEGECISLDFGRFRVENEDQAYRLLVADAFGPQAVIAEQFLLYNNSQFNTRDRVNNRNALKCGHFFGGWWFNGYACFEIFLSGEYGHPTSLRSQLPGIHWFSWKPNITLKAVQMKIRPAR